MQVFGQRILRLPLKHVAALQWGCLHHHPQTYKRMIKFLLPIRTNPDHWEYFYREDILDRLRCVQCRLSVRKAAKLTSTQGSYSLGNGLRFRLLWPLVKLELAGA